VYSRVRGGLVGLFMKFNNCFSYKGKCSQTILSLVWFSDLFHTVLICLHGFPLYFNAEHILGAYLKNYYLEKQKNTQMLSTFICALAPHFIFTFEAVAVLAVVLLVVTSYRTIVENDV
jgi:hypothetical protein